MKPRHMKPLRWPTNKVESNYMRGRTQQNRARTVNNSNENWLEDRLSTSEHKWTRQAAWGYRVFDFWCHELGIAVESDGPEHNTKYDAYRDEYNLRRSGIVVLRVRNRNEADARAALDAIASSENWKTRKEKLGIQANTKAGRRRLVSDQQDMFHDA